MTLSEAVIIWHQPHNRQVAVGRVRNDKALQDEIKAEISNLQTVVQARASGEQTGCVLTKERLKALTDLLAAATQETK